MRYQYFGKRVRGTGKTLWEIVGNLKNFGVGRLVMNQNYMNKEKPSFFKILNVVPYPLPEKELEFRKVVVVAEHVFYGIIDPEPITIEHKSNVPRYVLIPKNEEKYYLDRAKPYEPGIVKTVAKYITWPPLYKELWETRQKNISKNPNPIPNLKTITKKTRLTAAVPSNEETWDPPLSTNLYKSEKSVDDMYKELVKLQKIYISKVIADQAAETDNNSEAIS